MSSDCARRFARGDDDSDYPITPTVWLEDGTWTNESGDGGTYRVDGDRFYMEWPDYIFTLVFTFTRDEEGNLTMEPVPPMDPGDAILWASEPWIKIR